MCAVPSLEINSSSDLTEADFPELNGYRYNLERQGKTWVLTILGGIEGCLCNDQLISGVLTSILERFSSTGESVNYYPNDYRDPEMREVLCTPSKAVEDYPVSLDTPSIRVRVG